MTRTPKEEAASLREAARELLRLNEREIGAQATYWYDVASRMLGKADALDAAA
jgi:hypothetical protein